MRSCWMVLIAAAVTSGGPALGFSLDVREVNEYFKQSNEARSRIPFLDGNEPVHERLTDEALECGRTGSECERLEALGVSASDIREGVRSNDFPAQWLDSQALPACQGRTLRITNDGDVACILGSFLRASQNKERFKDRGWAYKRPFGMRGHFGDMQFLHSMAPEGQTAAETYAAIKMWMEVAYRVSRDEIDLRSDAFAVPVDGMNRYFLRGSRKVGDLFNYRFKKSQARGVALGQMLHIAQDSFAGCHVERDSAGRVTRFLSYAEQSSSKHADYDRDAVKVKAALSGKVNPVAFSKELLNLRADDKKWEEIEPLVERYFRPIDVSIKAGAGTHCQ